MSCAILTKWERYEGKEKLSLFNERNPLWVSENVPRIVTDYK